MIPVGLYRDSRQCRRCGADYLYPAYGSQRICGNCFDRFGRVARITR